MSIKYVEHLKSNTSTSGEQELYSFLDSRIGNDTFNKLFEIGDHPDYFYIFTHNNKQINRANMHNPFLAEITLTRVLKETYLVQNNTSDLITRVSERQPNLCLHEFIPGTVQKIAFDQTYNRNVALLYRILSNNGFIYRTRIYDLKSLNCSRDTENEDQDDIETKFDEASDYTEQLMKPNVRL